MNRFFNRIPGPGWVRTLVRLLILVVFFYLIIKGTQAYLSWHFENPIQPK
jgi:hypothetical protein